MQGKEEFAGNVQMRGDGLLGLFLRFTSGIAIIIVFFVTFVSVVMMVIVHIDFSA